jgi:lactobin A/cerein 7B family class IIb bacteriocin
MKILTTSDLGSVNGGLAPLIPVTWAVVADTGFVGAVGGAWATGWGIGTFVGDNIESYGSNANGQNPGGSSGTCRPEPPPSEVTNNCDANGSCW